MQRLIHYVLERNIVGVEYIGCHMPHIRCNKSLDMEPGKMEGLGSGAERILQGCWWCGQEGGYTAIGGLGEEEEARGEDR